MQLSCRQKNFLSPAITITPAYEKMKINKFLAINVMILVTEILHFILHCMDDKYQHCTSVLSLFKGLLTKFLAISYVCLKLCMWIINSQRFMPINCVKAKIFTSKNMQSLNDRSASFQFQTFYWLMMKFVFGFWLVSHSLSLWFWTEDGLACWWWLTGGSKY